MDPYTVLGLSKDANSSDIRKAYYKLAKEHHPDKNGNIESFYAIQMAYQQINQQEEDEEERHIASTVTISLEEAYVGTNRQLASSNVKELIHIPAGCHNGALILGQNFIVRVQVSQHKQFQRRGNSHDLIRTESINVQDAISGRHWVQWHSLDGRPLCTTHPDVIKPSTEWVVLQEGIPQNTGTLRIRFHIEYPDQPVPQWDATASRQPVGYTQVPCESIEASPTSKQNSVCTIS